MAIHLVHNSEVIPELTLQRVPGELQRIIITPEEHGGEAWWVCRVQSVTHTLEDTYVAVSILEVNYDDDERVQREIHELIGAP